jgi:hypothetical protein
MDKSAGCLCWSGDFFNGGVTRNQLLPISAEHSTNPSDPLGNPGTESKSHRLFEVGDIIGGNS